jgi:hypothetical protein
LVMGLTKLVVGHLLLEHRLDTGWLDCTGSQLFRR